MRPSGFSDHSRIRIDRPDGEVLGIVAEGMPTARPSCKGGRRNPLQALEAIGIAPRSDRLSFRGAHLPKTPAERSPETPSPGVVGRKLPTYQVFAHGIETGICAGRGLEHATGSGEGSARLDVEKRERILTVLVIQAIGRVKRAAVRR